MTETAPRASTALRRRWAVLLAIVLAALAVASLTGYAVGRGGDPGDRSPEAGFARDMQTHHQQAVQMALIVRGKSDDPVLRSVAYDIITTQQQQAGQMYAWLELWGLPQTGSQPAMAWMFPTSNSGGGMAGMTGMTGTTGSGTMPGMATPAEVQQLQTATGTTAEKLFLRLMIRHHTAGIEMAQAIQKLTSRPEVLTLAKAIAASQTSELGQLRQLLAARA